MVAYWFKQKDKLLHLISAVTAKKQLQETDHVHLLKEENGTWFNLDGFHMGIGGDDSWSPRLASEFLLEDAYYYYQVRLSIQ